MASAAGRLLRRAAPFAAAAGFAALLEAPAPQQAKKLGLASPNEGSRAQIRVCELKLGFASLDFGSFLSLLLWLVL